VLPHTGLSAPAPTSSAIPVDIRRFPWIKALASDYAFEYSRLAEFFAGDPSNPLAWRETIARVQRHPRNTAAVADLVQAQQQSRSAPAEALAASALLRQPSTVAVVTGQQAGLFGGPLFTLLKALTAVRLAECVRAQHGIPVVAVFWIDAEDHDWNEVRTCGLLDAELAIRSVTLGDLTDAPGQPVGHVRLDGTVEQALTELEQLLPATELTREVVAGIRQAYRPGVGMADAFARWLEAQLGSRGLVVYNSADTAAKPLVADLFAREIEQAATTRLASEAGAALQAYGYHAQVTSHESALALFRLNAGRHPIRLDASGACLIGEERLSRSELLAQLRERPEDFSPSVLLRPLSQDTLFPTVCYVSGPSELAYLAQLKGVYAAFGVPMPLVQPRATATIIDGNSMRFLLRHAIPLERLRAQDEAALNDLLGSLLPPDVDASLERAGRALEAEMHALAEAVVPLDATLEGATRSTLSRMQDDLKKLQTKIIQAAKRKDETLRRQFRHAQAQTFPAGQPQERQIGSVYFFNKYGPALIDRLSDLLPGQAGIHYVTTV
jgi:bacillithiol biosynthesis cysteine-adding enzyme BshC